MAQPQRNTPKEARPASSSKAALFVAVVILIGAMIWGVGTAHAGLFSFLAALVGSQQANAEPRQASTTADSQISAVIVLQPAIAMIQSATATDTPPIEGGDSLSPTIARMNATSTDDLNTQISIYIVRQGDTVSSVAHMFSVSMNTIMWANDLSSRSTLRLGQTLVILPVTGVTYTVRKGDTIQSIAKKYGSDIRDILNYNDITVGTALSVGQELVIPDAEVPTKPAAAPTQRRITKAPNEPLLDGWGWPSFPGYFACPIPGSSVTQNLHGHNAIDFGALRGTPIHASAGGTVIIARANGAWNGGYGNFVVVLHDNGTQTLYAHMTKVAVSGGQEVAKGQTIGSVGSTGLSTGPHLHFEVRGAQNPFSDPASCR